MFNLKKIYELIAGTSLNDAYEIPVSEGNGPGLTKRYSIAQLKAFFWAYVQTQISGITKGDTGPQGATGAQGIQGEQGTKGDKGDKGDQGLKGDVGPQGPQGIQGAKGDKGDKGDTGAQGVQGVQGEKGDQGEQGVQGEDGFFQRPEPIIVLSALQDENGIYNLVWDEDKINLYGVYGHFEIWQQDTLQVVPISKSTVNGLLTYSFTLSNIDSEIFII